MDIRVTRARKIFSDGRHNAFTGMACPQATNLISFRSATSHLAADGRIRVIASQDLDNWQMVCDVALEGYDLRDPKLIAFKGQVHCLLGGTDQGKGRRSMRMVGDDQGSFGPIEPLAGIPTNHWLWHACVAGDRLLATVYQVIDNGYRVALYASEDGLNWQHQLDFPVDGNETFLDMDHEGTLWALVRNDRKGFIPTLCTATAPYTQWQSVTHLPMQLKGPLIKRLEGGCLIICRQWDRLNAYPGPRNLRTDLFWLADGQNLRRVTTLPSGGDTSYAAWLDIAPGRALVSYYSSHEHKMDAPHGEDARFGNDSGYAEHSTPADIFLADVSYRPLCLAGDGA